MWQSGGGARSLGRRDGAVPGFARLLDERACARRRRFGAQMEAFSTLRQALLTQFIVLLTVDLPDFGKDIFMVRARPRSDALLSVDSPRAVPPPLRTDCSLTLPYLRAHVCAAAARYKLVAAWAPCIDGLCGRIHRALRPVAPQLLPRHRGKR